MIARIRAVLFLSLLALVIPILMIAQGLILKAAPQFAGRIPLMFHRLALLILQVRVSVSGPFSSERPLLLVSNHCSWLDICVLGSLKPLSFIAKSDVGKWPLFGTFARLSRTIFVDREVRAKTGAAAREIAHRLTGGTPMVLFAEGTSSDGNEVLPFKSALIGAAGLASKGRGKCFVQPVTIAYVRRGGIPLGRQQRHEIAWYGDMDLVPHLWGLLVGPAIDVEVCIAEAHMIDEHSDRKALAKLLHAKVQTRFASTLLGRD